MEREAFIQKLFARAKEAGFTDAEAFLSSGEHFSVSVFKGEIVRYSSAESFGLGFRGLLDGHMGFASTQVLDDDAVDLLVDGAAEVARLIENDDPAEFFPGSDSYPTVATCNEALSAIPAAERIAMARRLEEMTLAQDERIAQTDGCSVIFSEGEVRIVNTLGLDVTTRSNMLAGYVAPTAREGERVGSGSAFFCASCPEEIDLEATAAEAARRALDSLAGEPVASGRIRVLLRPEPAADLLETFSGVFSADAAQKGLSLLKGREGSGVAAECVTLIDDPLMPGSAASQPFDGEGVPSSRHTIIDRGRLNTLMHNLKTARKQGVQTTANAARSYASTVGISPTNFYFEPSDRGEADLLAQLGDGLIITDVTGLHAGANAITGDFSLSARGALVEGGAVRRPVKQITVAGNFFELLKGIEAVGGDLKFSLASGARCGSPSLLISGLSVAGK